ncbi:MAG: sulfatase [Thermoanaerobaculia bacterium]
MRRSGARLRCAVLACALVVGGSGSCSSPSGRYLDSRDSPRGLVLVNLSGLRADHLGVLGREPSPTPFLDTLAGNSLLYERALSVSSGPLASQVSLLSGLYPQEHGVVAADRALNAEAVVLPERFAEFGYRTAAFTGGGYAVSEFGIDRGFDDFVSLGHAPGEGPNGVLGAGLDYLREIGSERFFLYVAPSSLRGAEIFTTAPEFERLTGGFEELTPELLAQVRRAYEDRVRAADDGLRAFVEGVASLGLLERTVLVVTADRGFELGEHGRLGHKQLYPESLRVPLLISLGASGAALHGRFDDLVQTVDLAATLYRLAGLPSPASSGRLLPGLPGAPVPRTWAAAERRGRWAQESLLLQTAEGWRQLVHSRLRGEYDGTWVTRGIDFDTEASVLNFRIVSYLKPRTISVRVDGVDHGVILAGPKWTKARIELPSPADPAAGPGKRRVELRAPDCASPADAGSTVDRRCLSFKLAGLELTKTELFDLGRDPGAHEDLSAEAPELLGEIAGTLAGHRWLAVSPPERTRPGEATLRQLAATSELPEPPRP